MATTATLGITDTTIGKKYAMALSGIVLFGFLTAHMLGNLRVFVGPESLNEYAAFLKSVPALLWTTRLVVGASLLIHVWSAYCLWRTNRRARPIAYARAHHVVTDYAARTMIVTGPLVLLYVVYHLAHLTLGFTRGLGYEHDVHDVYANVITSFRLWPVALLYVVANVGLGVHFYHAAWSLLQTLGINHRRYNDLLRSLAVAVGLVLAVGFLAVPIGVQLDKLGIWSLLR